MEIENVFKIIECIEKALDILKKLSQNKKLSIDLDDLLNEILVDSLEKMFPRKERGFFEQAAGEILRYITGPYDNIESQKIVEKIRYVHYNCYREEIGLFDEEKFFLIFNENILKNEKIGQGFFQSEFSDLYVTSKKTVKEVKDWNTDMKKIGEQLEQTNDSVNKIFDIITQENHNHKEEQWHTDLENLINALPEHDCYIEQRIRFVEDDHSSFLFSYNHMIETVDNVFDYIESRKNLRVQNGPMHLCIIAPGAYGKTTLLLQIAKECLEKSRNVLYIPMRRFSSHPDDIINVLNKFQKSAEDGILLLDGFNETDSQKIKGKAIHKFNEAVRSISGQKNSKIICTSRVKISEFSDFLAVVSLEQLDEKLVCEYLSNRGIDPDNVDLRTRHILISPLYLSLFASMYGANSQTSTNLPHTRYELLSICFFRSKLYDEYDSCTEQEKNIIYKHILPAIANEMCKKSTFYFEYNDIKECIKEYFKALQKTNISIQEFDDYRSSISPGPNGFNADFEIKKLIGKTIKSTGVLRELIDSERISYFFFHQDIRDFFAAYFIKDQFEYYSSNLCSAPTKFCQNLSVLDSELVSFLIEAFLSVPLVSLLMERCKQYAHFISLFENYMRDEKVPFDKIVYLLIFSIQLGYELFTQEIKLLKSATGSNVDKYREALTTYKDSLKDIYLFIDVPECLESIRDVNLKIFILREVYARQAQLLRNFHDYAGCLAVAKRMEEIVPNYADAFHHQGKAFLYNFWGMFVLKDPTCTGISRSDIFESPDLSSDTENKEEICIQLVKLGIENLQKAAEKESTAAMNLLGMFYTTPQPKLKEYLGENFVNDIYAFRSYYMASCSSSENTGLVSYAKLQCVSLLLKKKVKLLSALVRNASPNIAIANNDELLTQYSLSLVLNYLNQIERYSMNFWHYYKGRYLEEIGKQIREDRLPFRFKEFNKPACEYFEEAYQQYEIEGDKLPCVSRRQYLIAVEGLDKSAAEYEQLKRRCIDMSTRLRENLPLGEVEDFSMKYALDEYDEEQIYIAEHANKGRD